MDTKEQLSSLRSEIDAIDEKMVPLFAQRMNTTRKVATLKEQNNLSVLDENREEQVVKNAQKCAGEELAGESALFMRTVMALSRSLQHKQLFGKPTQLLPQPALPKMQDITCAYQGVAGAWGQKALLQLFEGSNQLATEYFEDVFIAVKEGRADYGVVPIENSQTGAIGETYDLLRKYGCYIVRRTQVDINQCLLAPKGTKLEEIHMVLSHPEGFKQCRRFLKGKGWELKGSRNTAVAAKAAADAADGHTAAIGSRLAAETYGLEVLMPDIMDSPDNNTSFVAIASLPEYDNNSNCISVTFSTRHRSGALCEALLPFMAGGLNLERIESRPASAGSYRFFADLRGNILKDADTLNQAASCCEYFEVIGCYTV